MKRKMQFIRNTKKDIINYSNYLQIKMKIRKMKQKVSIIINTGKKIILQIIDEDLDDGISVKDTTEEMK